MTDMLSKLRSLQRGQRLRFTPSLPKVRYLDRKGGKQKRVDAGGPEERLARRMQGKMIYEFIVPMICARHEARAIFVEPHQTGTMQNKVGQKQR